MKKTSRLLSLLLALVMIAGLFPLTALPAFAEGTEPTVIPSVSAELIEPVYDEDLSNAITVPQNSNYTAVLTWNLGVKNGEYYDNYAEATDLHVMGGLYFAEVVFIPNEGYTFSESTTATFNGKTAEFLGIGETGRAYFRMMYNVETNFSPEIEYLDRIKITLEEPKEGKKLYRGIWEEEDAHYSITNVEWWTQLGDWKYDQDDIVPDNGAYMLKFMIETDEGYGISNNAKITINGRPASLHTYSDRSATVHFHCYGIKQVVKANGKYVDFYGGYQTYSNFFASDRAFLPTCRVGEYVDFEFELAGISTRRLYWEGIDLPDGLSLEETSPTTARLYGTLTQAAVGYHVFCVQYVWDSSTETAPNTRLISPIACFLEVYDPDAIGELKEDRLVNEEFFFIDRFNYAYSHLTFDQFVPNNISYSIISGRLPDGVELCRREVSALNPYLSFEGTPTETGTFTFTVEVVTRVYGNTEFYKVATKTYTIVVRNPYHTITYDKGKYACEGTVPAPVEVDNGVAYTLDTTFPMTLENYAQTGWALVHNNGWEERMTVYDGDENATFVPVWTYNGPCRHLYCEKVLAKAATCTEDGNHLHYRCASCGALFSNSNGTTPVTEAQAIIKAFGHNWYEVIDQPATTEHAGLKHEECARCGARQKENTVIPMIVISDCEKGIHKLIHHGYVAPTCEADGSIEYWQCTECNDIFADPEGQQYWWRPTILLSVNCVDDDYDWDCDNCGRRMPFYYKVTSPEQITPDGRYIIGYINMRSGNPPTKALRIPSIEIDKNGNAEFTYNDFDNGFPAVWNEASQAIAVGAEPRFWGGGRATVFRLAQCYDDWTGRDGRTRYSLSAAVDGHMVTLESGNNAYIDQGNSKYGHHIVFDEGVAKLVSGYDGDAPRFAYMYQFVDDPDVDRITFKDFETETDEQGTRYYLTVWDDKANDGKGGEVKREIEYIQDVFLYYEVRSERSPKGVEFDYCDYTPKLGGYFGNYGIRDEDFGGSSVAGLLDALSPEEIAAYAEKADVSEGDLVKVGTEFDVVEYAESDGEGNGLMELDITPKIFIGDRSVPISSSSLNGKELTVTVWAGKTNPNQIVHVKHDDTKEYFYREYSKEAPEGAKYFTAVPVYDWDNNGEFLGEFVTFTITEFSRFQLRETPIPEEGGAVEAGVTVSGQVSSQNPQNAATIALYAAADTGHETPLCPTQIGAASGSGQVTQPFSVPAVAPGTYDLVVTKPGHLPYTVTGIPVDSEPLDLAEKNITLLAGDLNGDGTINSDDLNIIWKPENYMKTPGDAGVSAEADLNGDGYINSDDLNIVWSPASYLKTAAESCTVPY